MNRSFSRAPPVFDTSTFPIALDVEENELWRSSVGLLVDTLEPLWPEAEERVRAVMMAEFDAEKRRESTVGDIRQRVLKQMKLANEGIRSEEELDAILTVLQTDERALE